MVPSEQEEFLKVLNGIAAIKRVQLDEFAIGLWWESMREWDLADFKAAAVQLLKTSRWMPCPADFYELARAGRDTPGEAWLQVRKFLRWGVNGYTLAENYPQILAQAIRMVGGAQVIAMCDRTNLHFIEKRFCEHFETLMDRTDVRREVPQIAYGIERPRLNTLTGADDANN